MFKFHFLSGFLKHCLPLILSLIYLPGFLYDVTVNGITDLNIQFILIFALSLLVYYGSLYFIFNALDSILFIDFNISNERISKWIFSIYGLFVLYICFTAPAIPLFESFKGTASVELSRYRELFFKARTGVDAVLVYINALFTVAILPYFISIQFIEKSPFRFWVLGFVIFSLLLSLEKSLILRIVLPLIILSYERKIKEKYLNGYFLVVVLLLGLGAITFLAIGKASDDGALNLAEAIDLDPAMAKYLIFNNPDNVFVFLLNRIFWIPYITAIDWLDFFNQVLHGKLVMGASSSFISAIFGMERINLERMVFEFEWGQNETGTGSSNTVYFIDIFLNFGWVGVIIINLLLSFFVRLFSMMNNPAAKACLYVYLYFFATSSFIAVLLSSGFILLLMIGFFVKPNANVISI